MWSSLVKGANNVQNLHVKNIYNKADINILTSTKNVNLNTILSYKKGDKNHKS